MQSVINFFGLAPAAAQRIVFQRLYRHVAVSSPRTPLFRGGKDLVVGLQRDILDGHVIDANGPAWRRLLDGAPTGWAEERSDYCCGAGGINFLRHVGRAVQRVGPTQLPLQTALLALIDCEFEPGCVDVIETAPGQRLLWFTNYGRAALQVMGEVRLLPQSLASLDAEELLRDL